MGEIEIPIIQKKDENEDLSENTKLKKNLEKTKNEIAEVTVVLSHPPKNDPEPPQQIEQTKEVGEGSTEPSNDERKQNDKVKNRSDIFSLNENKNLPSMIFSVGGAPSKVIHKTFSHNNTQSKESSGLINKQQKQFRNPLTGFGVRSKDEFKNKPSKRKDGNPLLGIGYKDDDEFFNTQPTQKIPPGGHSKGLW